MHTAVLQSSYIPWRGYFDIIDSVDLFVIYDDVQFSKGSWRNRNKVKTAAGMKWLTVPVEVQLGQRIDEVRISYARKDWVQQHRGLLEQSLREAPYCTAALEPWESAVAHSPALLTDLNLELLREYCKALDIRTSIVSSAEYDVSGASTERLIALLTAVGATSYLSGPAAKAYLDTTAFARAGIDLYYKSYDYEPYSQQHGEFAGDASIIDLLANTGPAAREYLCSKSADEKVAL